MKQCGADWKAAKAAGTTNGQTWSDSEDLQGAEGSRRRRAGRDRAPAAAPAPAPAAPAAAPAPQRRLLPPRLRRPRPEAAARKTAAAATGAGEFASEAEAKAHCPTDTVVWVNTKSHKYHYAGHRSYGTTKQGAYMCEADAKAAGDVAAKGEKPKS